MTPDDPTQAAPEAPRRYRLGTHRVCPPEETVRRMQPLLADMGITRVANVTGLDRVGLPVATACRPNTRSVTVAQGKGLTLDAAKASAIMEAVEIWHAERIVRPLKLASLDEMRRGHRVADVVRLPRAKGSPFHPHLPLLWIEAEDALGGGPAWLPFELVSTNFTVPLPPGSGCFQANSTGLASGNHPVEAVCHGLCEVIERDAATLWQHETMRWRDERALDLATVDDPVCREILERLRSARIEVHAWDTTTDVGIASFACVLVDAVDHEADPELGSGCHPDRGIALAAALLEAVQVRITTIAGARDEYTAQDYAQRSRLRLRTGFERLLSARAARRSFQVVPHRTGGALDDDLRWLLGRARAAGIEQVLTVDLSLESVGVPVVKVVVPGLEGLMDGTHGSYVPGERARRRMPWTL